MTISVVTVPKWGLAMEEGRITAWHAAIGDTVAAGDDLVDIETSKIANTVEAPAGGTVRRILATGDAMLPCGTAIAVIAPPGTAEAEIDAALASHSLAVAAAADAPAAGPAYRDLAVAVSDSTTTLRVYEAGAGGVPAVFLHGFGGDARTWSLVQTALAGGRRTLAIDLPGHGGSSKHLPDWSAAALARIVAAALDTLDMPRCHLIGHSMGAAVATALAEQLPDRIASLVGFAPADLGLLDPAYVRAFRTARRRSQMAEALAMLFADPAMVTQDMAEDLLRFRRIDGVDSALTALDTAILTGSETADPAAAAVWSGLASRALAVWGAQDRIVAPPPRETIAAACQWQIVADAGHMPFVERPAETIRLLERFLEGQAQ